MWDKIKAFFNNKIVIVCESVIIALASAGLIIGGVGSAEIAKIPALVLGIITALVALVNFIKSLFAK